MRDISELTHLSLFSGIGGLDLAAEWAGFRTVGQCEWADYPRAVLEKHWPGLPRWRDIRTLTGDDFYEKTGLRTVTVLSGGFPCQPFSVAGKRRGKEDDRYLWPEMLRVIQEIRPAWVVGENVAGIVSMALDTVLSDLESIGYACQALVIPACAVDAPHRRDRVAIVAYGGSVRRMEWEPTLNTAEAREQAQSEFSGCRADVADTKCLGLRQDCNQSGSYVQWDNQTPEQIRRAELRPIGCSCSYVSNANSAGFQISRHEPGFQQVQPENGIKLGGWWPAEPDVGRVANGIPHRVDRLKCLGNAVVPQQFYPIFRAIAEVEEMYG